MTTNPSKGPESPKEALKPSIKHERRDESTESLPTKADVSEFVDELEGAEGEGTGEVAEKKEGIGENRQATGGKFQQFSKKMTDEEAESLKKKLLEKPPMRREMVQEIRSHIHKEIIQLEKAAGRYKRKGKFRELAYTVRRIRELRGILSDLFNATAEMVKNLWLRVVHGIV